MSKFIFTLPGSKIAFGPRRDEFIYVEAHAAYVFEGKLFHEQQFNETFKRVFARYREMEPSIVCFPDGKPTPEELVSDAIVTLRHFAPDALAPAKGRPKKEQPAEVAAK